jgi:DNA-binding transcriptional ArsR family regulator
MKAHADLKKQLASKNMQAFVVDLCHYVYEWSEFIPAEGLEYKIFEEFRLRQDTGEKTRLGLDKKQQLIPDVVLFVKPGYRSLNQGQCFTVALEIKGEKGDLMSDDKLYKYLGWTDFLFVAVPADLADDAQSKVDQINADHPETISKIGIVQLDTGTICRWPKRSEVTIEKQNLVLQNAVYNYAFKDAKTIFFTPEELPTFSDNNLQENCILKDNYTQQHDVLPNNTQENCILKEENNKRLSDEEKAARKAAFLARQEFREKRAVELAEKSTVLNEDIRQRLMAQSPKAQEVFWKIRESKNGKQLQEIVSELDYSQRTAAYGLASLTSAGLIKRAGSRKTGAYTVTDIAACDTTCATCSIALQCKDYKPI